MLNAQRSLIAFQIRRFLPQRRKTLSDGPRPVIRSERERSRSLPSVEMICFSAVCALASFRKMLFFFVSFAFFAANPPLPEQRPMTVQIIALSAAITYALSFIFPKRGFKNSAPITVTFLSLLIQSVTLLTIALTAPICGNRRSIRSCQPTPDHTTKRSCGLSITG